MNNLGNKETFSRNLEYYSAKHHKTRVDICEDLGYPYTTVTGWFNGTKYPRIDKIERLANYFGVQKSDLIEEKPVTISDDGLSEIISIFSELSPDNRPKLLELARLYLASQCSEEERQ